MQSADITPARIEAALETAALLAAKDETYLPVFERLERELEASRQPQATALDRARRIAQRATA